MTVLKRIVGIVIIFVVVTGAIALVSASSPASTSTPWPTLKASATPNPADIKDIKALVDRYYDVGGEAAGTFDLSQFPTFLVDDPTILLDSNQTAFMTRIGAQATGFLSYQLAFFTDWKQGTEKLEKLQAQLKAQGRAMTANDLKSISGPNGPPPSRRHEPVHKTNVIYNNFTVDGSRAIVEFDDGAVTQNMFFVKTMNGWRIAGQHNLQEHA